MRAVGIEEMNAYIGRACVDVRSIFERRGLNAARFDGLMMVRKSVGFPWEDPITHAVNAARPITQAMNPSERARIEVLVTATESGVDFGKSVSTYVHEHLKLSSHCRLFEVKQACYGGTAALQMAAGFIAAQPEGAKALVIATDVAVRSAIGDGNSISLLEVERRSAGSDMAEPSSGTGAVAMLVSDQPRTFALDLGASGCHSYQVMDTCRPTVGWEAGSADLSLASYLDCLDGAYKAYAQKVEGANLATTFDGLAFHAPFPGMVRGAHRRLMRTLGRVSAREVEEDFQRRVAPSLVHCREVGNVYSASLYLALCGAIQASPKTQASRIGLFSYGSGCSSEFFSGVVPAGASERLAGRGIAERLGQREVLGFEDYDRITSTTSRTLFGVEHWEMGPEGLEDSYRRKFLGQDLLVLRGIRGFQRRYAWS